MARQFISGFAILFLAITAGGACAGKKAPTTSGAQSGAAGGGTGVTEAPAEGTGAGTGKAVEGATPTIYFEFNSYTIDGSERDKLQKVADMLKGKTGAQVTIEGHCDDRGSNEYNLALGERRALAVKSYLQKLGIDGKRLSTISYGEERPVDPGHSEAAWAKNRRGEIIVNR